MVVPCGHGGNRPGVNNAAQWIRTGFHDFATHDKAAGTGGLDASLLYEVDRPENEGSAFNDTFADMSDFLTPRSSAADLIALAVVASVASCGGSKIPLRAGRIDAKAAGPAGVPKPDDSLESTIDAFARTGFNMSDMIALVACGHTVGGVHSVDFPDITGGEEDVLNVPQFDSTGTAFDTAVVDEYLDSNGANPLVFGANDTTNSDKRVFGADGNSTMNRLKDRDTFQATCASLFERMIDTVPSTVTLSEPIELVDVKPYIDRLELSANASALAFEGRVRVRTSASTGRDNEGISIALDVVDNANTSKLVQAARARARGGTSTGFYNEEFTWFEFATELDAKDGIKAFDVQLTTEKTGAVETFDNAGTGGFPSNDNLLYAQSKSCIDATVKGGNMTVTIGATVREDADKAGEAPMIKLAHKVQQQGVMLPRLAVEGVAMKKSNTSQGGYVFYSVDIPIEAAGWSTKFDVVLPTTDGEIVSGPHGTNDLSACSDV